MVVKQGETYGETQAEEPKKKTELVRKKTAVMLGAGITAVIIVSLVISLRGDTKIKETEDTAAISSSDETAFEYTPEEIMKLREYGFTSEQIEQARNDYTYAEDLIAEAEEKIRLKQKELADKLSDPASPEYQKLLHQTYLGEPSVDFPETGNETPDVPHTEREIADYEKLPTRGKQLFVKLTLQNGEHLFMALSPERWKVLPDIGNIVVDLTVAPYGGINYIVDVKEFNVK
jgi:hypothetical protein